MKFNFAAFKRQVKSGVLFWCKLFLPFKGILSMKFPLQIPEAQWARYGRIITKYMLEKILGAKTLFLKCISKYSGSFFFFCNNKMQLFIISFQLLFFLLLFDPSKFTIHFKLISNKYL